MPLYEYKCKDCGKITEEQCSIDERPSKMPCKACKGEALLVPSLSSFHLKGGCWASDGYNGNGCSNKKKG